MGATARGARRGPNDSDRRSPERVLWPLRGLRDTDQGPPARSIRYGVSGYLSVDPRHCAIDGRSPTECDPEPRPSPGSPVGRRRRRRTLRRRRSRLTHLVRRRSKAADYRNPLFGADAVVGVDGFSWTPALGLSSVSRAYRPRTRGTRADRIPPLLSTRLGPQVRLTFSDSINDRTSSLDPNGRLRARALAIDGLGMANSQVLRYPSNTERTRHHHDRLAAIPAVAGDDRPHASGTYYWHPPRDGTPTRPTRPRTPLSRQLAD